MASFFTMAHSGWRYLVVLALAVAIIKYLIGWLGKGKWTSLDNTINRVTPIVVEVQWLLGLITWIVGSWWSSSLRSVAWEHPITLTVAVAVMSILSGRAKRATTDQGKFQMALIAYVVTAILVVLGIWLAIGSFNVFGNRA